MTDEEKRAAIEALVDAEPYVDDYPAPEFLARVRSMGERIRAILDDAPSVEWDDGDEAWHDGWNFSVAPRTTGWRAHVWHRLRGDAQSLGLPDRAAAKARAVAIYAALRGVT